MEQKITIEMTREELVALIQQVVENCLEGRPIPEHRTGRQTMSDFINQKNPSHRLGSILVNRNMPKFVDELTWHEFKIYRNAGKVTWAEFVRLRDGAD